MRFEYSAGAFIYKKEGEKVLILFLVRDNKKFDIPKGHIEEGENAEQAGKREILEEAGLRVDFIAGFREISKYFFVEKGTKIVKRVTLFLAKAENGKVKISDEHIGFKWMGKEEALEKIGYKDMKKLLNRAYEYIEKYEKIAQLNADYATLPKLQKSWDLSFTFVPGDGPVDAKTMLIGQAPGANEDILKKPFIGRSGKVLDRMLEIAGLKREKVYITSCVQFFPPKNRGPTDDEVALCKEFLMRQIEIINPKNIILLGNFATNNLLGFDKVSQNHGKVVKKDGRNFLIAFHPAMALRSSKVVAKLMEEDFKSFKEKLEP
ncbi:MAG TPA: uracil-DNA glycosylase family protein [Candidatus Aquilonibacter sp.]|nr:uracil-DNA glycosylase family protein [Candidatus Aquilonibacter sp.]